MFKLFMTPYSLVRDFSCTSSDSNRKIFPAKFVEKIKIILYYIHSSVRSPSLEEPNK